MFSLQYDIMTVLSPWISYFMLDKNIINRNFDLENVCIENKMSLYEQMNR